MVNIVKPMLIGNGKYNNTNGNIFYAQLFRSKLNKYLVIYHVKYSLNGTHIDLK